MAERAVEELGMECLHLSPDGSPLSRMTLALATSNMNGRLRKYGLSAREIWTQRDQISGSQLPIDDRDVIMHQRLSRLNNHLASTQSKSTSRAKALLPSLQIGDLVYLHVDGKKTEARPKYMVIGLDNDRCQLRKFTTSQFRSKIYDVHPTDCYPVAPTMFQPSAQGPIRGLESPNTSDSDSDSDTHRHVPYLPCAHTPFVVPLPPPGHLIVPPPTDIPATPHQALPSQSDVPQRPRRETVSPAWQRTGDWIM